MSQIHYRGQSLTLRSGESVLDGLLRAGIDATFSCRSGSCHVCLLRATRGLVPVEAQRGLRAELAARHYFLPCRALPEHELWLEDADPADLEVEALVAGKRRIDHDLYSFKLEPLTNLTVLPGQHVTVVHPDGAKRPYSVAGLPEQDYFLELHVRRVDHGLVSRWLCDTVAEGDVIRLQRPTGAFVHRHRQPGQPLLLIATGTGLAPVMAITRSALAAADCGPVYLLHGARDIGGLYLDAELRDLQERDPRFHYWGVCSSGKVTLPLLGGRVGEHLSQVSSDLAAFKVFLAGNPDMVTELSARCRGLGAKREGDVLTDAFVHADHQAAKPAPTERRHVPEPDPTLWAALEDGRLLARVLKAFYDIVFEDPRLGPYFVGVTRQRLVEKQYLFLRSLITGSRDYFGQRPRNAHHWMVISDELFDYRLGIMADCLRAHGLAESLIARWHGYEEAFRGDIVKQQPFARTLAGLALPLEGFDLAELTEGTLCDGCQRAIEIGEQVRFHRRTGATYCSDCNAPHPG